jgi:hypothetical protein
MFPTRPVRRISAGVALAVMLFASTGCSSCRGTRGSWVYAISRSVYSYEADSNHAVSPPAQECGQEGWAMCMAVVLVLPLAIDTVLLPVTIPHDLFFMG